MSNRPSSPDMCRVFTYWEGRPHPFTELCIASVRRVFGSRHVHLGPNDLRDWIVADPAVLACNHMTYRSDYIRTKLLRAHGGWWFDCDVLLCRNPDERVAHGEPMIWNLVYNVEGQWHPLINNGILFTPANSEWIRHIERDFDRVDCTTLDLTWDNEDIGQEIYEAHSFDSFIVRVGHEHDFNSTFNVDADYRPFFDGRIRLDSARYGIHIGASLARWAAAEGDSDARRILAAASPEELRVSFPNSIVAQYLAAHGR